MGLLDWFRPSPRMIAARWIAESMRREPQEWVQTSSGNDPIYTRGDVRIRTHMYDSDKVLWVLINGETWPGKPERVICDAIRDRNALLVTLKLADAHA